MKIALVTGSNRGIGLEIAKKLLKHDFFVYFGARNEEECRKVLDKIGDKNADFILIDYENHATFEKAAEKILHAYGGLDVLISNAAIASKLRMNFNEAENIMAVNFWSTKKLIEICLPIMQSDGRIVVLSSMISHKTLYNTKNQDLLEELSPNNVHLTLDRLEFLAKEFLEDFPKSGKGAIGWPKSSYGVSKQLLNCLVRILSKDAKNLEKRLLINSCCPGFCSTDLSKGNPNAKKSPEDGAQNVVNLAILPKGVKINGVFLCDA